MPNTIDDGEAIIDKNLVAAGWGSISGENAQRALADKLQQTSLKILNNTKICQKLPIYRAEFMYCALDTNFTQNSNVCYGDSGNKNLDYYF